ncbi:restriction endonuclease [Halorubellus sp. JP-L1]|uniref:McrC family protein n=1 Tax=Halorubellus sp. JP-L1 TaxID=2715753 RepID=UPI00140D8E2B|nr:restriction endonuclease [Halorubellus sp. JP-L1]NHN41819.1 restriction endonuclease [Halorubellus sp. JP-L1]
MTAPSLFTDGEFDADIELGEYESSVPFELSKAAAEMLEQEVNAGEDREGDRIKLTYNRDGDAILTATQYVGVVSLRDGPTVQIRPEAAGTNLLYLLRYAHDTTAATFDSQTAFRRGETFLDALGALYESELRRVLNRGLHTDYRRRSGAEEHLRGQLNLQQQLQRQPPTPTAFECTYDELTHDIAANQAILYAASILLGLVSDPSITRALRQHQQILRRRVSLTPVTRQELESIQLTRLSGYYEDILRLAELVIGNAFIGELEAGTSAAFAMLVNMNTVFENAVERATQDVVSEFEGWRVEPQEQTTSLLTSGKHEVQLKPDVTVYDETDTVRFVGDAKWKTDLPGNPDFYQMTSYMLSRDAPGLLIYPDCRGQNASQSWVAGQFPLSLIELPTAADVQSYEEFVRMLESGVEVAIDGVVN